MLSSKIQGQNKDLHSTGQSVDNKIRLIQRLFRLKVFFRKTNFNDLNFVNQVSIKIQESNAPLTKQPLRPAANAIDKAKAEKFILQFESPDMQATARKIIENHIQYISFDDFEDRLKEVLFRFNQFLLTKSIDHNTVSVMIEPGHSSEWVASMAVKYLSFIPKKYHKIEMLEQADMSNRFNFSNINESQHTLVIFDDWSISGEQLSTILHSIIKAKKMAAQSFHLNIIVAIPLMTHHAFETFQHAFRRCSDISLKIITTPFVSSLEDLRKNLTESEFQDFNEIIALPRDAHLQERRPGYSMRVLAYSDWKVPDYVSMPIEISSGMIPWNLTLYYGKRFDEVPKGANGNKFIPKIESPYHKNNPW